MADYTGMRCLYCGKQLALLRRLTGGGEFCSEAHKQTYHEEYNRLALSRLLQAQSKPEDIRPSASTQGHFAAPPGPAESPVSSNTGSSDDGWTTSNKTEQTRLRLPVAESESAVIEQPATPPP